MRVRTIEAETGQGGIVRSVSVWSAGSGNAA